MMDDIQRNVNSHAMRDMVNVPTASHGGQGSLLGRLWSKREEWAAQQPSFGAQLAAMWREGVKDVRQTINEVFFGKGEHMAEAGTPMNPTQIQVTKDLDHSYRDAVDDARFHQHPPEEGRTR